MRNSLVLGLLLPLLLMCGCTAPNESDDETVPVTVALSVEAQPPVLPANGASMAVVLVELLRGGEPVPDSTEVILMRTVGSLLRGLVYTRNGVALDTLTADTTAASGWVIAYAMGTRDSVQITLTE